MPTLNTRAAKIKQTQAKPALTNAAAHACAHGAPGGSAQRSIIKTGVKGGKKLASVDAVLFGSSDFGSGGRYSYL